MRSGSWGSAVPLFYSLQPGVRCVCLHCYCADKLVTTVAREAGSRMLYLLENTVMQTI